MAFRGAILAFVTAIGAAAFAAATPLLAAEEAPEAAAYGVRSSFSDTAAIVEWSKVPPRRAPLRGTARSKVPTAATTGAASSGVALQSVPAAAPGFTGRRVNPRFTSGFGYRADPINGGGRMHAGLDMAAPMGTAVISAARGRVTFAGWRGGYGNCVIVAHGDGLETLYGHLSAISVEVGNEIGQGTVLGLIGSTGHSTGPHLHYEVRKFGHPIAPL